MEPLTVVLTGIAAALALTIICLMTLSLVRQLRLTGGRTEPPETNQPRRNVPGGRSYK
jgi:hypothetical protein